MITLIRAEFYRMATIRSSWVSILVFGLVAAGFGLIHPYGWALFSGVGAFGIAVLSIASHYQHRTIGLLYLARPRRLLVLAAQIVTVVGVAWALAVVSGLPMLLKGGVNVGISYRHTLVVAPVMAAFAGGLAAVVRRSSWLFWGFALWFVFVEGLAGQLSWHLPISSYLAAASVLNGGDAFGMLVFAFWALASLTVAAALLARDLPSD